MNAFPELRGGEPVYADVPTIGDVTVCSEEAREAVRARTASPTAKDEAWAEDARKGGTTSAAYRAGYRVCVRKEGS